MVRMYSIISRICAYACMCGQARNRNLITIKILKTMAETKEKKDYSQQPTVEKVEANETYGHDLFTIVNHNGEHLIAVGNQVVTREKFATREEAIEYIDRKPWELIFNSCAVMFMNLMKETIEKQ